jgi:hypothetical protein
VSGAIRFATSSEKTDAITICGQDGQATKEFRWIAVAMKMPSTLQSSDG